MESFWKRYERVRTYSWVVAAASRRAVVSTLVVLIVASTTVADDPPTATELKITRMLQHAHHSENLFVRFRSGTSISGRAAAHSAAGAAVARSFRSVPGLYLVSVASGNLSDALSAYLGDGQVMYAEPDYLISPSACASPTQFPGDDDDTEWGEQWGLNNVGQDIPAGSPEDCGTADADIDAPEAWNVGGADEFTGDPAFRIGVLDRSITCAHSDFVQSPGDPYSDPTKSNIWTNLQELNGDDLEDDDGNGCVDDLHGCNFTIDPPSGSGICSGSTHGTYVAGIIGARGNNGKGISGVAWRCQFVELGVIGSADGTISNASEALQYMIDNNIRVSNSSWDFPADDISDPDSLRDMIEAAGREVGHVFVVSAGNQGYDLDDPSGDNKRYPPNYRLANVIAVAATDKHDAIADFSNWGLASVDLGAPGDEVLTLFRFNNQSTYSYASGTSFAAPHVTGVFALVMGKYPSLKWDRVVKRVLESVRPVDSLGPKRCNGGENEGEVCEDDNDCPEASCVGTPTVTGGVVNAGNAMNPSYGHDCNENGVPDHCDVDCEADGCDTACGGGQCPCTKTDTNDNQIPDGCEILQRLYVDEESTCSSNCGSSWATAYSNLQIAIDDGHDGTEVWVKEGSYDPIELTYDVIIYGGFAGAETKASQSDPTTNQTYIVGDGEAEHVVTSAGNDYPTTLRGFHIKDGDADGTGNDGRGGGMLLENSNATIVQCVFHDNDASLDGGAVANVKDGGGAAGSPRFINCTFHNNKDATTAIEKGGAVYVEDGAPSFANCLFYENWAEDGGAVYVADGSPVLYNCTVADNLATNGKGGAIYDTDGGATVRNSILYYNYAVSNHEIYNESGETLVTYSDVAGGWSCTGCTNNINSNPYFTDKSADDYTLNSTSGVSPCIDAGNNDDLPFDLGDLDWDRNVDAAERLPKDLGGQSGGHERVSRCDTVDMGAFEQQALCSIE